MDYIQIFSTARSHLRQGLYSEAANIYLNILCSSSPDARHVGLLLLEAKNNIGVCYLFLKRYRDALDVFNGAILLLLKAEARDRDIAIAALNNSAVSTGGMSAPLYNKGLVLLLSGLYTNAERAFQCCLQGSEQIDIDIRIGMIRSILGSNKRAVVVHLVDDIVLGGNSFPVVEIVRGYCLYLSGQLVGAYTHLCNGKQMLCVNAVLGNNGFSYNHDEFSVSFLHFNLQLLLAAILERMSLACFYKFQYELCLNHLENLCRCLFLMISFHSLTGFSKILLTYDCENRHGLSSLFQSAFKTKANLALVHMYLSHMSESMAVMFRISYPLIAQNLHRNKSDRFISIFVLMNAVMKHFSSYKLLSNWVVESVMFLRDDRLFFCDKRDLRILHIAAEKYFSGINSSNKTIGCGSKLIELCFNYSCTEISLMKTPNVGLILYTHRSSKFEFWLDKTNIMKLWIEDESKCRMLFINESSAPTISDNSEFNFFKKREFCQASHLSKKLCRECFPFYGITLLQFPGPYPEGIDIEKRELYLSDEDFIFYFCMSKSHYRYEPKWKQVAKKKDLKLF